MNEILLDVIRLLITLDIIRALIIYEIVKHIKK